ncbi:hypothetical protein [Myxococcus sp. RHSTA-1-4]|uniref:hypothetical protein n=1 Tax=Myxococcus sp. RHSTA-1-4 TaxID=2874601 RepID=UPI001CBFD7C2|nr:hypothetical protein [Myxococcus sp. RHSTA-1-4]MBZ4420205.1 hypothetical protein [Myxococcus sp. RHSTA-1-4]
MSARADTVGVTWGWVRNPRFDLFFILGTAGLGCVFALAALVQPRLFPVLLAIDVWLLGYHHVVSTYTRLGFDRESFQQHRFLVGVLPLLIFGATYALYRAGGVWPLMSLYFYWQGWHYLRQSYGVSRILDRASRRPPAANPATAWVLYLLPLAGLAHRSAQGATTFLGLELRLLPVPQWVDLVATAAVAALAVWGWLQARALRSGAGSPAQTLYVATHAGMFALGYYLIPRLETGWLGLNVWHNAQYILVVWLYNNRRFGGRVSEQHRFLSTLSQGRRVLPYMAVCLGLSAVLYLFLLRGLGWLPLEAASLLLVQTLNFHHYIVDSLIWKVRQPTVRRNLGLAA